TTGRRRMTVSWCECRTWPTSGLTRTRGAAGNRPAEPRRWPVACQAGTFPAPMTQPLRVAVVGAGPAGFFLCEKLLAQTAVPVEVDLFERLPVPYGLVRFGVAPDHEKIKNVTRSFDKVAARPGFRYFGNVDVGKHVSLEELHRFYHAVAFTTGAQTD